MLTLGFLQNLGVLPGNYQEVKCKSVVYASEFVNADYNRLQRSAVVLDGYLWAATRDRMPAAKADVVYSSDGNTVGCWKRSEKSFYFQELSKNLLATKKIIRGGRNMSEMSVLNTNGLEEVLNNVNVSDELRKSIAGLGSDSVSVEMENVAEEVLNNVNVSDELRESNAGLGSDSVSAAMENVAEELGRYADGAGSAQKIDAFDGGQDSNTSGEKEKAKLEKDEKRKEKEAVYEEIKRVASKSAVTLDYKAVIKNQSLGRMIGFVTKTDPVVKASLRKKPVQDDKGHYMLNQSGFSDQTVRDKFNNGKKVASKYLVCEAEWSFAQSKPGKAIGFILKTPSSTEMDIMSQDGKLDRLNDGEKSDDFSYKVLSCEAGWRYLASNYDGKIREDEDVLGKDRACWLKVKLTGFEPRDSKNANSGTGAEQPREIKTTLVIDKDESVKRDTLFTDGNYFPLETYVTAPISSNDPKLIKEMNNNFAACIASYKKKMNSDEAPAIKDGEISLDGSGDASSLVVAVSSSKVGSFSDLKSKWVDGSEKLKIKKYDSKKDELEDVRLPLREEGTTKNGAATYRFKKIKMDDAQGNTVCALNDPKYQRLIQASHMSKEEFADRVRALNAKAPKAKSSSVSLSSEEYLAYMQSRNAASAKSTAELQREIMNMTAML